MLTRDGGGGGNLSVLIGGKTNFFGGKTGGLPDRIGFGGSGWFVPSCWSLLNDEERTFFAGRTGFEPAVVNGRAVSGAGFECIGGGRGLALAGVGEGLALSLGVRGLGFTGGGGRGGEGLDSKAGGRGGEGLDSRGGGRGLLARLAGKVFIGGGGGVKNTSSLLHCDMRLVDVCCCCCG